MTTKVRVEGAGVPAWLWLGVWMLHQFILAFSRRTPRFPETTRKQCACSLNSGSARRREKRRRARPHPGNRVTQVSHVQDPRDLSQPNDTPSVEHTCIHKKKQLSGDAWNENFVPCLLRHRFRLASPIRSRVKAHQERVYFWQRY